MTETTDIKAMREGLTEQLDHMECYGGKGWLSQEEIRSILSVLDQLEAERQQREAAEKERVRIDARNAELNSTLERWSVERAENANEMEALRAALQGTQETVVLSDETVLDWGYRNDIQGDASKLRCMIDDAASLGNYQTSRQPKPVVVLPKIRDSKYWNGVEIRCDKYQLDVQASLEAAGIDVKDGE